MSEHPLPNDIVKTPFNGTLCRQNIQFKGDSGLKGVIYIRIIRFVTTGHVQYRGLSVLEEVCFRRVSL